MSIELFILIFYPTLFLILICYVASFCVKPETRDEKIHRWQKEKEDYERKSRIPDWDAYYTETNRNRQEMLRCHPGNPNTEQCVIL